jgi:hypothetical protein
MEVAHGACAWGVRMGRAHGACAWGARVGPAQAAPHGTQRADCQAKLPSEIHGCRAPQCHFCSTAATQTPIAEDAPARDGEEDLENGEVVEEPAAAPAGRPEARGGVLIELGRSLQIGDASIIHLQ